MTEDSYTTESNGLPFFLRKALMPDLSQAARILADGFYADVNPASKWFERLQTQMSLESNIPVPTQQHEMWVACNKQNGKVLAFCEVDNRPPKRENDVRPYMCNLAVHTEWRNQGLAQRMIEKCEDSILDWDTNELYLKVKEANTPAVKLYTKMEYEIVAQEVDGKSSETLFVMKKELTNNDEDEEKSTTTAETTTVSSESVL